VVFSYMAMPAIAQDSLGFTNKAEAKNPKVNGLKEGKWIEYFKQKNDSEVATKHKHAPFYYLTIYKDGKPYGMVREYYKSGKLKLTMPYVNGKQNGLAKGYYENGTLFCEIPLTDSKINGVRKVYTAKGMLMLIDTIANNKENGIIKLYDTSEILEVEVLFTKTKSDSGGTINMPLVNTRLFNTQIIAERTYYKDGKLKSETTYSEGIATISKNYGENGNESK